MDDLSASSGDSSDAVSDGVETGGEESCPKLEPFSKKVVHFSAAQRACLNSFYLNGMRGCGKQHAALIAKAAEDTSEPSPGTSTL